MRINEIRDKRKIKLRRMTQVRIAAYKYCPSDGSRCRQMKKWAKGAEILEAGTGDSPNR
jgi:hypothetical protein